MSLDLVTNWEIAQKDLITAKSSMLLNPDIRFIADIALQLIHRISEDCDTARTDGYTVEYNPHFFMSLSKGKLGEQACLIAHEIFHPVLQHLTRRGIRIPDIWNMAGDLYINYMLVALGFKLPKGGLYNKKYNNAKWSTDQIYDDIVDDQKGKDIPSEIMDIVMPGSLTEGKDQTQQSLDAHVDSMIQKAVMRAEVGGYSDQVPSEISEYVKKLNNPVVPWTHVLRRYAQTLVRGGFTFRSFNKRYMPDFYLPAFKSNALNRICIAHDTSGSVTHEENQSDLAECHEIVKRCKPKHIDYLQWGSAIVDERVIKKATELEEVEMHYGGGTKPQCVLDWANEHKVDLLIIFTDGDFNQRILTQPNTRVIWVIFNNKEFVAPFGETIYYTRRE